MVKNMHLSQLERKLLTTIMTKLFIEHNLLFLIRVNFSVNLDLTIVEVCYSHKTHNIICHSHLNNLFKLL